VVIVTHDNRIVEYADRIVHIEDGRVGEVVLQGAVS
jgi:ABC-type lipoprotein export system ATPase subunit